MRCVIADAHSPRSWIDAFWYSSSAWSSRSRERPSRMGSMSNESLRRVVMEASPECMMSAADHKVHAAFSGELKKGGCDDACGAVDISHADDVGRRARDGAEAPAAGARARLSGRDGAAGGRD